jgi:hypothetical protein
MVLFVTGKVRWRIIIGNCGLHSPKLARSVHVRKSAILVSAEAFVSIIRALIDMALITIQASFAVAEHGKLATNWCGGVDLDVSIMTIVICTIATNEMNACRDAIWGGVMGEVAVASKGTGAFRKKVFANGNFVRIMGKAAIGSAGTGT